MQSILHVLSQELLVKLILNINLAVNERRLVSVGRSGCVL